MSATPLGARVVVAHPTAGGGREIADVVGRAGFTPWTTTNGVGAIAAFHPALPALPVAALLDVGLQDPFVFLVIERIRAAQTTPVFVALIGSVHDSARYRRRPTNLHGADLHIAAPDVASAIPGALAGIAAGGAAGNPAMRPTAAAATVTDWALEHHAAVAAGLGSGLAQLTGAAGAALAALRSREAGVDDTVADFERRARLAGDQGRPFG
ncbi:MAG: hypothetical protein FJ137_10535 [Deltaproteobacteria bacterium]|nr:hypothetical protein [Deltaproteobacteria bacterium]